MSSFLPQIVAKTIESHAILPKPESLQGGVLVALSGGADSVALLRVLLELGYACEAAHCNFGLRGEESERDENFVRDLCKSLDVKLYATRFATYDYASAKGISIEMAARDLRYDFFNKLLDSEGLDCVAVAHHRDDNVETMLLNMVRGTGLQGLVGMEYRRGNIVRPMLDVSRKDVLDYLADLKQNFVTDSSNLVADVKRNIVRLKLMPILRELNPSVEEVLTRNASHLREVKELLDDFVAKVKWQHRDDGNIALKKSDLKSHLMAFELLSPYGFNSAQIDDIWNRINETSGAVYKSGTHELLRDRELLILREIKAEICTHSAELTGDGLVEYEEQTLSVKRLAVNDLKEISKNKNIACLDADKVGDKLILRRLEKGDRFVPFGMKGSKLVSHFLRDCKVDGFSKEQQLVLTNGESIVWLVGMRPDDRFRICDETKNVVVIEKL